MNEQAESTKDHTERVQSDAGQRVRPRNGFVEFRPEETEQSIPARFEQQAAKYPSNAAVVTKHERVTYDELNRAANRLAHAILAQRGDGNEPTAFLLGPRALSLAAILGILKAGKALVGLDSAFPLARNSYMLEHSQAGLIVADKENLSLASKLADSRVPVVNLDEPGSAFSEENIGLPIAPDALATVVYTSGSTGQPKGVIQTHRNILHGMMVTTNLLRIGADDRVVTLLPVAFMGGIVTDLRYLLNGGCVCPFDIRREGIQPLANWLTRNEATVFVAMNSTLRSLIGTLSGGQDFSKLRLLHLGGEVLYPQDAEMFKKYFGPDCLLGNGLAGSEMTAVCLYLVDQATQIKTPVVPVGYEHPGVQVLLWDEADRDVGINRVGQIVVKSRYLSPGYWRDPELTQATFLPDPEGGHERLYRMGDLGLRLADGCLVDLGREDNQVKIRGYRVEVVEVETALLALDGVREAVVVPREDGHGEQRLVAYWVPAIRPAPTVSSLRRALGNRLPGYMTPSAFVAMESLPLGATGKVDRQALPEPAPTRPELANPFVAPRNQLEARLTKIWEDVLGIQPVGVQDSFSDLGGDSLSHLELLLRVEDEFRKALVPSDVLQAATVEQMARLLDQPVGSLGSLPTIVRVQGYARYVARRLPWLASPRALSGGIRRVLEKNVGGKAAALGGVVLSYPAGSGMISWMTSQQWIRSILFGGQVRILQQCLMSAPPDPESEQDVVRLSIASNILMGWRCRALSQLAAPDFEQWVCVTGLSTLVEACKAGRGVVLVQSHVGPEGVAREVLRRAGLDVASTIGGDRALQEVYGSGLRASQLYQGTQILQRGGIVRVLADGYGGRSAGMVLPFFGRSRTFRAGFAELALSTGAAVVPACVAMDVGGHMDVQFLPPLDVPGLDHDLQVESLVFQYAEILRREWRENLANFRWRSLKHFTQLPPASGGVAGGAS